MLSINYFRNTIVLKKKHCSNEFKTCAKAIYWYFHLSSTITYVLCIFVKKSLVHVK